MLAAFCWASTPTSRPSSAEAAGAPCPTKTTQVVAQQMVVSQTCYTTADIAWLQANGAPWEVVQAAQGLWVGW